MSTPTFGPKPRPETRIRLVGGPDFLDKVMDGTARAIPQNSKHATNRKEKKMTCREHSRGLNMCPPLQGAKWGFTAPETCAILSAWHWFVNGAKTCGSRFWRRCLMGVGEKSRITP